MIISSIVISAGYLSYDIVLKQFLNYKNVNNKISEALMLRVMLQKDFSDARVVKKTAAFGFSCKTEQDSVLYQFDEKYILRKKELMTDTFFIPVTALQATFLNEIQ